MKKTIGLLFLLIVGFSHTHLAATAGASQKQREGCCLYEREAAAIVVKVYSQKANLSYLPLALLSIIIDYCVYDACASFTRMTGVPLFKQKALPKHYPGLCSLIARKLTPLNIVYINPVDMSPAFRKSMHIGRYYRLKSVSIQDVFGILNIMSYPCYAIARQSSTAKDLYEIDQQIFRRIKSPKFIQYYLACDDETKAYHQLFFGSMYSQYLPEGTLCDTHLVAAIKEKSKQDQQLNPKLASRLIAQSVALRHLQDSFEENTVSPFLNSYQHKRRQGTIVMRQ